MDWTALLTTLLVGAVAGWLAGLVTRGTGFGILADIIIGLLGALVGSWLFRQVNIPIDLGNVVVTRIVVALIGAVILLFIIRLLRPRRFSERFSGLWRRR